ADKKAIKPKHILGLLQENKPDDYLLKRMLLYPLRSRAFYKSMAEMAQRWQQVSGERHFDPKVAQEMFNMRFHEGCDNGRRRMKSHEIDAWIDEAVQNFPQVEEQYRSQHSVRPSYDWLSAAFGGLRFTTHADGGRYCRITASPAD